MYYLLLCFISSGLTFYFCNWEFSNYIKSLEKMYKEQIKYSSKDIDYYRKLCIDKTQKINQIETIIHNKLLDSNKQINEIRSVLRINTDEDSYKSIDFKDIDLNRVRIMRGMYPNGVFGCG